MSYLGIYTNNLKDYDLKEHKKANTIEELEKAKTNKDYLIIYQLNNDILEDAEFLYTKVLR